jgi:8-oxo-dGTP pyrophosphatase MutT (NUDIX family)
MDPRLHLLQLLDRHQPHDEREAGMRDRIFRFVTETPAALDWRNPGGHVTGSAWVLDPSRGSVLLTFHRKLGRWLQLGGHVEDGETVPEAALREAHEESGLAGIELPWTAIFDVDVHEIPGNATRAAHLHYDVRFLCLGPDEAPRAGLESREVAWVKLDAVAALNPDASMMRMVAKSA